MKVVLQKVKNAKVTVDNAVTGEIQNGYLVLLGITHTDTKQIADKMLDKISKLRIFEDESGKINKSILVVVCLLFRSSHFMPTAEKETVRVLNLQQSPTLQMSFTNTFWSRQKRILLLKQSEPVFSAHICRWSC